MSNLRNRALLLALCAVLSGGLLVGCSKEEPKETSAVPSGNPNKEDNLPVSAAQQGRTAGQAGSSGQ